jgi:hypothetical protein
MSVAAGRDNGQRQFVVGGIHEFRQHLSDARTSRPEEVVVVEGRRLDDLCGDAVNTVTLLKIDVEGHEFEALSGATRILENGRAQLVVEFFPSALEAAGSSPAALRELLSRTHDCTAIVRSDGAVLPGAFPFDLGPKEETFNTFWKPRPVPQRDHTGVTARSSDGTAA